MKINHRTIACTLIVPGLVSLLACSGGGGGGSTSRSGAHSLTYTNPVSGQYQFVRNPSSTPTHLVLDLLGPAPIALSGVGFHLTTDNTKVSWSSVGSDLVASSLFTNPLIKTHVVGDTFQAGIYQWGSTPAINATPSDILATIALDLKSDLNLPIGTVIPLAAPSGKALILNPPGATPATDAITISMGTLIAN